ncbi:CynX/NimT family MFS transporter [Lactiplantibacillus fabifermentans]|uniref:Transport protein n=2 Tax=Lactiplantibacillus fabifermentans TaxID=483011 RepID=A0A0R2NT07_9LACO|nr:MFS transporter [Lactiplantibacillus fabifermentans]ETY75694.1 MFS transporter [Lactiplantibacillus fabifermentans T30PCM01]KRO28788.1 transport protein [Lactiplantibacillus fabifermentans DSM 21115]
METTHQHSRYLTLGMMLAATNMRLPITMMPGLISSLKKTLGLPSSMAGLLTTIPLLTFAVMSPIIARWGRRFGNEWTIYGMLIILALGSYLRVIPAIPLLFLGTLLVGIGADGGNVLIPAIIKDNFPDKIEVATSQYTISMLLIGSLGTGISGVLAAHWSLPLTMAVLSVIGLLNLVAWLPNLKYNHRAPAVIETPTAAETTTHGSVWGRPLAWVVTAFFGLQALVYYSLLTWLPTIFTAHGFSIIAAGNLVTIMQLSGLPMSYLVPATSGKKAGVKAMVAIVGIGFIGGIAGVLLPGTNFGFAAVLCVLLGLGSGAAFSLAVVFFTQKTTNGFETADLSGMAQSAGYLLAALGPVLFGWLGAQIGWSLVLWLAIVFSALLTLAGTVIQHRATIYD